MISKKTMLKLANEAIANAPNTDWQNNGGVTLEEGIHVEPVIDWKKYNLGNATVGFFKFQKPFQNNPTNQFNFIGFTLAVMRIKGKLIHGTRPVIGAINEKDYSPFYLVRRFCPQCHSIDSVKSTSKVIGPECVVITYRCRKCSYIDRDVMD